MHAVKKLRSQLELWKQYFDDVLFEIGDMKERIEPRLSNRKSKINISEAKNIISRLNATQQPTGTIIERLKELDDLLKREDPNTAANDERLREFIALSEDMDDFEKIFGELKNSYRVLSKS